MLSYFHKGFGLERYCSFIKNRSSPYCSLRVVFKESRNLLTTMFLLIFLLRSLIKMIQGTYDMVEKVWKIRNLYQREKGG